ncbi:MAG: HAD family phosphatase [Planctomycetes bacterium]|nr:HAD family phosphatase [Planctomycetota bacterium]
MERIESVIFDWGRVLIDNPTPGLMRYCAEALGVSEEDLAAAESEFTADFQKGVISEEAFWERVCTKLKVPEPRGGSLWAEGFEAACAPRSDMFSLAARLHEDGCKTAILSNTEVPAMDYFHQLRHDMFDVLVLSCAEGTRKPETRIYEIAVESLGLPPGRTLFIDDTPEHINAAKQAGLNTILFKSIDQVRNELALLGVKEN